MIKKLYVRYILSIILMFFAGKIFAMQKLESIDQALYSEFNSLPNQAILYAVFEQNSAGEFYSSDPKKYAIVRTGGRYTYLAGQLDEKDLEKVVDFLASYDHITVICHERYHAWFSDHGYKICARVELCYSEKNIKDFEDFGNFTTHNLDAELFPQCEWYGFIAQLYGTAEQFLTNGFGVVLCDNNTIVSEAYAAAIGRGYCEVGIVTNENYRGKGAACYTAGQLVKQCLARQLIPVWSCDYENPASLKVALKLGFKIKRYYAFLRT